MSEIMRDLNVQMVHTDSLNPDPKNARIHSRAQIKQVARSIEMFGWVNPVIVDQELTILAGHARLEAAKMLGLDRVPVIRIDDMTKAQKRAYMLAANKIAENAGWDKELLALELSALLEIEDREFDITATGFEMGEIDIVIGEQSLEANDETDLLPHVDRELPLVSEPGDLWHLGDHRLLCSDATSDKAFSHLMDGATAEMVFTDPPYNVAINGNVCGLGKARHGEFAMASGEMSSDEFINFLETALANMAAHSADGSLHFIFMDWRHGAELQAAADGIYAELKNICVWVKSNGGMGSLYRSAHEFVFVYKRGTARHVNNIELGRHGRNRTNVWSYAGMNAFGQERDELLGAHPTVKPVALVRDAILDCSNRGGIVLDPFAGSGTTFIAAERVGRVCYGLEIDPGYCDLILRRYRAATGTDPVHGPTAETFAMREARAAEAPSDPGAGENAASSEDREETSHG